MNLLAKETTAAILGDAGLVIVIGFVVVFAVLLLLVAVIKIFGSLMSRLDALEAAMPKTVKSAASAPVMSAPAVAPIVGNTQPVSTRPEIQNGIEDEVVAAISGAVACMASVGTQYAVRRIVRK